MKQGQRKEIDGLFKYPGVVEKNGEGDNRGGFATDYCRKIIETTYQ